MKRCTGMWCNGAEKPESEFYVKDKRTGRLFSWCKECHAKRCQEDYQKNYEQRRDVQRQYALEHREERADGMRRWRANNPERAKEIAKRSDEKRSAKLERRAKKKGYAAKYRAILRQKGASYREANRDILRQRQKEWREANPNSYREIHSRWKRANRELVNASTHRCRAAMKGCAEHHTAGEWEALKAACHYTCLCCGRLEPEIQLTRDHVTPIDAGGSNCITNIQPLCKSCNSTKHTSDLDYREEEIREFLEILDGSGEGADDALPPVVRQDAPNLEPDRLPGVRSSRSDWELLDPDDLERYVEKVFQHYRTTGFPDRSISDRAILEELGRLLSYRPRARVRPAAGGRERPFIRVGTHGLGVCWSFFPHAASVQVRGRRSVMDTFLDDELLRQAIRKRLKYGTYMTDGGLRKSLGILSGTQAVSNFRPAAAIAMYDYAWSVLGSQKLRVWDMSAGYGGRLLGALASGSVQSYTATEPCVATHHGLERMREKLASLGILPSTDINLLCQGSEDFAPDEGSLDVCFTSPPYYDHERYSDEETQSYKRFPTYREWLAGFWVKTLQNCHAGLRAGGILAINVAGTRSAPTLVDDTREAVQRLGFSPHSDIDLLLANVSGGGYKYEPLLVFRK